MKNLLELDAVDFYNEIKTANLDEVVGLLRYSYENNSGLEGRIREKYEDFYVKEIIDLDFLDKHKSNSGEYYVYILQKTGVTTLDAIRIISKSLGINTRDIQYLGLKDKNAVTEQYISIKSRSKSLPSDMRIGKIKIRLIGRYNKGITKNLLKANFFRIFLHLYNSENAEEKIKTFSHKLNKIGFANFYGYQRFGSLRPINHKVGLHILRREYEEAIRTLLGVPSLVEDEKEIEKKLKFLENGNIAEIESVIKTGFEKIIVKRLLRNKNDYKGAIKNLPPSVIRIFIEAFSSYVFNLSLSNILEKNKIEEINSRVIQKGFFLVPLDEYFSSIEAVFKPKSIEDVRTLKEDLSNRKAGVAIATPGYLTTELPEITEKILEKYKISCDMFLIDDKPEISYPGQFRTLIGYARDFSYTKVSKGLYKFEFLLPRGSFATIVLRELIRPKAPPKYGF